MPQDYYPDMGEGMGKEAGDEKPPVDREGMEDEGTTALLPKSILAGKTFKPGDELVLKVVHLYEDEVEVEYAKEPPKEGGMAEHGMSANDELDAMESMKG